VLYTYFVFNAVAIECQIVVDLSDVSGGEIRNNKAQRRSGADQNSASCDFIRAIQVVFHEPNLGREKEEKAECRVGGNRHRV
jgi:hypothetical protein